MFPEAFSSGALHGVPTLTVADGHAYFLGHTPPAESGSILRAPSAGGPPKTMHTP